jgi:chitin disaccharide deacetylase
VEAAHAEGILSAASLMVAGPAAADAIARARRLPNLRVGLHLVLVDGAPLSDRPQIPNLIDSTGRLRTDLAGLGTEIMLRRSLRSQVAKEIGAQFEAFRATGLPLDHVNSHRHFHLHPAVAAAILAIGPAYGMRALRVPAEPWHILAQIDPRTPRGRGWMTSPWASLLRRRARHAGLTIADAVFGLAWSGGMTAQRFAALAKRLPAGMVEVYFHPATTNTFPGAAPGYRYVEEFAALCDADCIAAVRASRYALGGYG